MPLDPNGLWIIDYRTASLILEKETLARRKKVEMLCQQGRMKITHREREKFQKTPELSTCYIANNCQIILCQEIIDKSKIISQHPDCKDQFVIDQSSIFIAAAAMCHGLQVISDAIPSAGLSLPRICAKFAIPYARREDFFDCI